VTIREIAAEIGKGHYVHQEMVQKKVCALWVPPLLTEKHNFQQKSFFTTEERYAVEGDDFLHSTDM
jgi:hypothetical protein